MIGYTLTYDKPRSAQPRIQFKAGARLCEIAAGETVQIFGTAEDFAVLPPGVTAKPTAKAEPEKPKAGRRSTMTRPARAKE